jgi:hypothetical protein
MDTKKFKSVAVPVDVYKKLHAIADFEHRSVPMQLSYMVEAYDHPATRTGRYSGLKKDQPLKYKPKEKHVAEMEN